ncbi:MAG: NADH-quinone oxidoreductase subunit L [Gemmataceae bacterium]
MSDVSVCLWLIPGLPLLACLIIAAFGRQLKGLSHWPCIVAGIGSCICSFVVFFAVRDLPTAGNAPYAGAGSYLEVQATWIQAGKLVIPFVLRADGLTAVMLLTVTFIGSLIAIFAVGYMHGDEGYPRFFAEIALFIFSMTGLVLADNFLVLYAFWEGVGLCSYLLIGFWFHKPAAAAAARKAFLVTRLGDAGFLLGIILLWNLSGYSLNYEDVFANASDLNSNFRLAACLLLLCGAVGKSAQFPLYVWLPDAMEGPTPVSALIHAATMVTAGVYLVARCTPLFILEPAAQVIVAVIGAFTALLAALIALTQNDLKRVLAYSTISQLGYMFLGLGSGAVIAGIFHLFTHAFFKALLFLAAGSVMHAMGGIIDMRRFGGLRHVLKTTHATFLCGAAALAGVPLLSGFWSKDEILDGCLRAAEQGSHYRSLYFLLLVIGLITAGLTAFYTFRAYFMTFWGEKRIPPEAGHHAHESPPVMTIPLIILAVGAVAAGIIVEPFTHGLSGFLEEHTKGLTSQGSEPLNYPLMLISTLIALAGIGAAWWMYVKQPGLAGQTASSARGLYQLSLNKFHVDDLYDALILTPLAGFTAFCRIFDLYVLDGLVDLIGQIPRLLGVLFRPVQNGLVQFYAIAMILGLTVFLLALAK